MGRVGAGRPSGQAPRPERPERFAALRHQQRGLPSAGPGALQSLAQSGRATGKGGVGIVLEGPKQFHAGALGSERGRVGGFLGGGEGLGEGTWAVYREGYFLSKKGGFSGGARSPEKPPKTQEGGQEGASSCPPSRVVGGFLGLGGLLGYGGSSWVLGGLTGDAFGWEPLISPGVIFCVPSHQSSPLGNFEGKFYRILWPVWPG
jgi:hypothetical protein